MKEYDGIVGHLTQDEDGIFHSTPTVKKIINGKQVIVGNRSVHKHNE